MHSFVSGLQNSQGDCVKKRCWKTRQVEWKFLWLEQLTESGRVELTKGKSWCEIDDLIRESEAHASESGQQRERTRLEEVAGRIRSSRYQLRTKRDVLGLFARDLGVRRAKGNWGAIEILEARSSTKLDACTRKVERH